MNILKMSWICAGLSIAIFGLYLILSIKGNFSLIIGSIPTIIGASIIGIELQSSEEHSK